MDKKKFILKKSEPRDIEYIMVPADISEKEKAVYEQNGWSILCECEEYVAYTAPVGTAFPDAEKLEKELERRKTLKTVIVLNAAALLLVLIIRFRTENALLSAVRSIMTFILSIVFGFSAMRLTAVIRKKK